MDLIRGAQGLSGWNLDSHSRGMAALRTYTNSGDCRHALLVNFFQPDTLPTNGPCTGGCDNCQRRCVLLLAHIPVTYTIISEILIVTILAAVLFICAPPGLHVAAQMWSCAISAPFLLHTRTEAAAAAASGGARSATGAPAGETDVTEPTRLLLATVKGLRVSQIARWFPASCADLGNSQLD